MPPRDRYHFEKYTVGVAYLAEPGKDYQDALRFRQAAWKYANLRGMGVKTKLTPKGIEIQFGEPS